MSGYLTIIMSDLSRQFESFSAGTRKRLMWFDGNKRKLLNYISNPPTELQLYITFPSGFVEGHNKFVFPIKTEQLDVYHIYQVHHNNTTFFLTKT